MKHHNLLVPLLLVALTLSVFSVPSIKGANPNILYVNPPSQPAATPGSTVTYQVKVAQIDPFNAWDIMVKTDANAVNPASLSITPNTLTGNFSISLIELTHCVNNVGTGCNPAAGDGPGVVHSAVFPLGAPPSAASISGVLFTITYTAGAGPSSPVTIFNDVIAAAGVTVIHTTKQGTYGTIIGSDFNISASPTSLSLAAPPGGSAASLISLNSVGAFSGSVDLTASVSPLTLNVNATVDTPVSLTAGGSSSSNLKIVVGSFATAGPYIITVTGSATIANVLVSHSVQVTIQVTTTIADYNIFVNPDPLTPILASYNGTANIIVQSLNGFSGTVSLSAVTSPIGILNGPVPSLSSNTVTVLPGQNGTVTLFVRTFPLTPVPAPSPSGLYAIIIVGTSGSLTHSGLAVVTVTPAIFFLHLGWIHHLDYASTGGNQTFDARVQNNSTGTVVVQVVVKIRFCGLAFPFALSAPTGTPVPGGNVALGIAGPIVHITFSVHLPTKAIGQECLLRAALFYGASADPTTTTLVRIRKTVYPTNIVHPLIAVNGKVKTFPSASIDFQFSHTLTGKFFVLP